MPPAFGTSGLRGLSVELTDALVAAHVRAFLATCETGGAVLIGQDLRDSSPRLAAATATAATAMGVTPFDCGRVPTPALALAALTRGHAAIMVTGSHIPADRNGLKFYTPRGEITKADEARILAALDTAPPAGPGARPAPLDAATPYRARTVTAFGPALAGLRIGLWEQSSVARDLLASLLSELGAEVLPFGRSDSFVPVDTEAVPPGTLAMLADRVRAERLDAVISTDGDADRPLVIDDSGRMVPGDVLGPLVALTLRADRVVTPISSNGLVDRLPGLTVTRTRIGSPHVIAGMAGAGRVLGYEANGGVLLGFEAQGPAGPLPPLLTRDAVLPIVAALARAKEHGGLAALRATLPARFTATGLIREVESARGAALVASLAADPRDRAALLGLGTALPAEAADTRLDGLRLTLTDGTIVALRPSGNAPEFRLYSEADDPDTAARLLDHLRARVTPRLAP